MDPIIETGVHLEVDWQLVLAVLAFTGPILVNAWWISMKIIVQLKLIAEELVGNKEDHAGLRKDSAEIKGEFKATCDAVQTVNDEQWKKLVDHKIKQVEHEGRIKSLEEREKC